MWALFYVLVACGGAYAAAPLAMDLTSDYAVTVSGVKPEVDIEDKNFIVPENVRSTYRITFLSLTEYDGATNGIATPAVSVNLETLFASGTIEQREITVATAGGGTRTVLGMHYGSVGAPVGLPADASIELDVMINGEGGFRTAYTATEDPVFPRNTVKVQLRARRWFDRATAADLTRRDNYLVLTASVQVVTTTSMGRAYTEPVLAYSRDPEQEASIVADTSIVDKRALLYDDPRYVGLVGAASTARRVYQFSPATDGLSAGAREKLRRVSFEMHWARTVSIDAYASPMSQVSIAPAVTELFGDMAGATESSFAFTARLPYFTTEARYDVVFGPPDAMDDFNGPARAAPILGAIVAAVAVAALVSFGKTTMKRSEQEFNDTEKYIKAQRARN